MKSARRVLLRRSGTILPVVALAVTASVGALTSPDGAESVVQAKPVSYANGNPLGSATFTIVPGGIKITGWTFDPSSKKRSLRVVSTVSGHATTSTIASRTNKTVARRYAKIGTKHGFSFTAPVREGVRTVCAIAKDVGRGRDATIGCLRRATFDYGPYGRLDTAARPGHVLVTGWLIDNDRRTAPVTTRVTVDGVARDLVANVRRDDVARANTSAGRYHGFAVSVPVAQGRHKVCAISRNIGIGSDNSLGCRTVTVNDNPVGELSVGQRSGKLRVSGFAFDRDNTTTPLRVTIKVDNGAPAVVTASNSRTVLAKKYAAPAAHGYDQRYTAAEGKHTVCVTVTNIGYGADAPACRVVTLDYTPTAKLTSVVPAVEGLAVFGWATDPDTSAASPVRLTLDNRPVGTVTANAAGTGVAGHNFVKTLATRSGRHTVCAVAVNQVSGTRDSSPACATVTVALSPAGRFEAISRVGDNVQVSGWAYDPDTTSPVTVLATVDNAAPVALAANQPRKDVAAAYPSAGGARGFASVLATDDGKHTVCLTLRNVGGGKDSSLGCKLVIAVHPKPTSAPRNIRAGSGFGAIALAWTAPADDGGAPADAYRVAAAPGRTVVTVPGSQLKVTLTGLAGRTPYYVTVSAHNAGGWSPQAAIHTGTQSGPAPQTTPAPVSTSRYMRNIRTCNTAESAEMRSFGVADAKRNPSGHRYLQLLDIGGQSSRYGGVMLSAIVRFVSYGNLLKCSKAYVDGYASGMRASAPATIAMGVNNDLDVSAATGRVWATQIVNPLVSYARRYSGITIAGANDIEPGFSASYSETRSWVSGYLGATNAPFIFNGSADGCAWTVTNRGCNNGWTMAGLYNLAAGMAPTRMVNLPQVYNYTMADQWKFISLTGIAAKHPRINFGGPLTEAVACAQANHSCGSISGRSAWQRMWRNLQSHPKLRVGSLPYSTDLRIDS